MALYQTPKLVKVKTPELVKIKLTLTLIMWVLMSASLSTPAVSSMETEK